MEKERQSVASGVEEQASVNTQYEEKGEAREEEEWAELVKTAGGWKIRKGNLTWMLNSSHVI